MQKILIFLVMLALIITSCKPLTEPAPAPEVHLDQIEAVEEEYQDPVIQKNVTDDSGKAMFEDPSTNEEVEITVVDSEGETLSEMEVVYKHGKSFEYEVFLVLDSKGNLVAADFYLHNSQHTIEVIPGVIQPINPDKAKALAGYMNDMKMVSKSTYLETIPGSELRTRINNLGKVTNLMIAILKAIPGFAPIIMAGVSLMNEYVEISAEAFPYEESQWDMYEVYDADLGYHQYVFVESQPPVMQEPTIDISDENLVTLSLLAIDPTEYPEDSFHKAGMPDYTIFMAGPTDFSDLEYYIKVEDEYESHVVNGYISQESVCIQGNCTNTDIQLGILKTGKYILYYYAVDEVGNASLPMELGFEVINPLLGAESEQEELSGNIAASDMSRLVIVHLGDNLPSVLKLEGFQWITGLTWSPDGSRLAFTNDLPDGLDSLGVINADGSGKAELVKASGFIVEPIWSPDGKEIVYNCFEWFLEPEFICFLDPETGGVRKIAPSPNNSRFSIDILSWTINSMGVIFEGTNSKPFPVEEKIYRIDKDGVNFQETDGVVGVYSLKYSPDGTRVAYSGLDGIHVLDLRTGENILIFKTRPVDWTAIDLAWSPYGDWIAFAYWAIPENAENCGGQNPPSPPIRCDSDVWVVPSEGGQAIKISDTPGLSENYLAWGK